MNKVDFDLAADGAVAGETNAGQAYADVQPVFDQDLPFGAADRAKDRNSVMHSGVTSDDDKVVRTRRAGINPLAFETSGRTWPWLCGLTKPSIIP